MEHPNEPLFQPLTLGGLQLPNRIVMASMTRARGDSQHTGNHRMLGGGSPRKELFADETPAHVLSNDGKHFPNLVDADGACASLSLFVSSHVDQQ